jgi:hypothetical protein
VALASVLCITFSIIPILGAISEPNTENTTKVTLDSSNVSMLDAVKYKKYKKKYKIKYKRIKTKKGYRWVKASYLYSGSYYKKTKKYKKSKSYNSKVGASYKKVTSLYVECKARCSCSLHSDYKEHSSKFKNYCPYCKRYGTLKYEQGKSCPEGMWVCSKCDADYCLVHGKSHTSKAKYLSKPTPVPKPKPVTTNNTNNTNTNSQDIKV